MTPTLIFSDLDGCLLNKSDYSFADAQPVLSRVFNAGIPLILASSKTEVEMRGLASEMHIPDAPLICENGGVIFWSRESSNSSNELVMGTARKEILALLTQLKAEFQFESFEDMGVAGVAKATDLPVERAEQALQRCSTEPLLWNDAPEKLNAFEGKLNQHSLSLTRGGRFWHVAGKTTKGAAMKRVWEEKNQQSAAAFQTLAIGDSPIDQSMLDIADFPIGIPSPDGVVHVKVNAHNGIIATKAGAAGWAEAVAKILDRLAIP